MVHYLLKYQSIESSTQRANKPGCKEKTHYGINIWPGSMHSTFIIIKIKRVIKYDDYMLV